MKKIDKSCPPNTLTQFYASNPAASWNDFRHHFQGDSYDKLKELIFCDQGGVCGYCEDSIIHLDKTKRRVEHFHDKSDKDLTITNWGLDWDNVFGVCLGGSDKGTDYQLPKNLSCDSHKEHYLKTEDPQGIYLNPLKMPFNPIFELNKSNGFLLPNVKVCQELDAYLPNNYDNFYDLVDNTIKVLNLNCDRLAKQRLEILYEYNRIIAKARQQGNREIFQQLTERWFQKKWPSFFTVRRCLLGEIAEQFLAENGYSSLN
ncbi:TIGR02646 family protein [Acinetobacter soli]|uniref:TIGR02646 family protein n=1 Tax=Acinetobacter soli TaxID=487316 RepID=UPI003A8A2079